jgi:hypothetical protein
LTIRDWPVAGCGVGSVIGSERSTGPRGLPEGESPLPKSLGRLALSAPGCGPVTVLAFVPGGAVDQSFDEHNPPARTPPGHYGAFIETM